MVGLPISTVQNRSSNYNNCAWTSSTVFTTTTDLSDVKTAFDNGNEIECEVIAGAGAGVMVKVSDITYSSPTYTVTMDEEVVGAASGRYCDAIFDNWKYLGQITSTDTDCLKEIPAGDNSDWFSLKVECRGSNVAIRQQKLINETHQEA